MILIQMYCTVPTYFQKTFNTISDYMPTLPFFGGDDEEDDDKNSDETSENSSIRRPKFKYTLRKVLRPLQNLQPHHNRKRWYDKFFFGSEDQSDTTETTADPTETTTERSKIFDWFKLNADSSTERIVPIRKTTPKSL